MSTFGIMKISSQGNIGRVGAERVHVPSVVNNCEETLFFIFQIKPSIKLKLGSVRER